MPGRPDEHWAVAYLGPTDQDCAGLGERVQRDRGGRVVARPRPQTTRGRDAAARALTGVLWAPAASPAEGDVVLMRAVGRRVMAHHVGVYCEPGGVSSTLHALDESVFLHELRTLAGRGFEVEGVYAWTG